jgi:hypothetical protein
MMLNSVHSVLNSGTMMLNSGHSVLSIFHIICVIAETQNVFTSTCLTLVF